jgi:hypothetical protein
MNHQLYPTCICIVILLLIPGVAAPAAATDWGVNTTHYWVIPAGPSNASAAPIQGAINAAATGDTITVEYGVYDEAISVVDKDLTITGTPSGDDRPVLYESSGAERAVVYFTNTSPSFGGFVLENNVSTDTGIAINVVGNVTIRDVTADGFEVSGIKLIHATGPLILENITATGSRTGANLNLVQLSNASTLRTINASGALEGEGIALGTASDSVTFEDIIADANSLSNINITQGDKDLTFSDISARNSVTGYGINIKTLQGTITMRNTNISSNYLAGFHIDYLNTHYTGLNDFTNVTASGSTAGPGLHIYTCYGSLTLTDVTAEDNYAGNIYLDYVGQRNNSETALTRVSASRSSSSWGIQVHSPRGPLTLDNVTASENALQNIRLDVAQNETTFRTVTAMDSAASRGIEIGAFGPLILSGVTASGNNRTGIAIYAEGPSLTLQDVTANENGLSWPAETSLTETAGIWLDITGTPTGTIERIVTDGNRGPGFYIRSPYMEAIGITADTVSASDNLIGVLFSCTGGLFTNLTTSANTFAGMMFDKEASGIVVTECTANENPFGIMLGGNVAGMAEITYDVEKFMDLNNSYYYDAVYDMSGCENITLRDCTAQNNTLWDLWVAPVAGMAAITVEDLTTLPETTVSHSFSPSGCGLMMSGRAAAAVPALPAVASSNQFLLLAATHPSLEYTLNTPLTFTVPGLAAGTDNSLWTSTGGAWTYWPGGGDRDIPNATISLTGLDLTFAGTYVSPLSGAAVPTPPPGPESDSDSFDYPPVTRTPVPTETPQLNATETPREDSDAGGDGTEEGADSTGATPAPTGGTGVGPTQVPGTSDDQTPASTTVTPTTAPTAWAGLPVALGAALLLIRRR